MKIAISGASGMVGRNLAAYLRFQGHTVLPMVRRPVANNTREIAWNPDTGQIDSDALVGVDAVIHLAGENIASKRWSAEQKQKIIDSRVKGTELIAKTLASMSDGPTIFIAASAIGFYGDRKDAVLDEADAAGSGFLAEVCQKWEAAANIARTQRVRVTNARIGVVLSTEGGALAKMLPLFQLGVGGNLGNGRQWMSWISLEDLVRGLAFLLSAPVNGPANMVAPNAVTNADFTKVLGQVLHRPAILPAPSVALKLALGEMADELLLSGQHVVPKVLQQDGFEFLQPTLRGALESILSGREKDNARVG